MEIIPLSIIIWILNIKTIIKKKKKKVKDFEKLYNIYLKNSIFNNILNFNSILLIFRLKFKCGAIKILILFFPPFFYYYLLMECL